MKRFYYSKIMLLLLVFAFVLILSAGSAKADFTFGEPVNLKTVIPVLDPAREVVDCFSCEGLEMYVSSFRSGGYGDGDLWVLKRASKDEGWGPPENLGPAVNSSKEDSCPCLSADGLTLYFCSNRPNGYGYTDIYTTTRTTRNTPWGPPMNLGPNLNSSAYDYVPWITTDGIELYFASSRAGGYGEADIYVARRPTTNDQWGDPVNLGPTVNFAYFDGHLSLSADGLLLFFADDALYTPRPGGYGGGDMWMSRRANPAAPWQTPVNLGPTVNGSASDFHPRVSPDGRTLYFATLRDRNVSTLDSWQASIIPIVDFNADGEVDLVDLVMLIDNWGTNNTLYDIGLMPWGDGIVDVEDLKVFIGYWEQENGFGTSEEEPENESE
jgi:prepilin-type processing-associated H-X9-DG protein